MESFVFILMVFMFTIITGCSSNNCINGEDKNINISVGENIDTPTNMGFSYLHNVTINIVNVKDSTARSVKIDTYYCNDLTFGQSHKCENNSFSIRDIPPNAAIKKYFEYNRILVENQYDGRYQLQYKAESCLPITIVNNSVFIHQR